MSDKILMKGNEAVAEAAIRCGCRFFFGYPITPQTEISAYMAKKMKQSGGTFLQAESEIASINMVYGAAGAGARVMTSSSSPGISLKGEGISYMAGANLPCVIVDIMRGGPGLGSIQPAQSDYFQVVRGIGHGDMKVIVLAPASVQEMVDLTALAFDLGDKYRMPVVILADGLLGQMMEPVSFPPAIKPEELPKKPWATVGTGLERKKNIVNSLFLEPEELESNIAERQKRYDALEAEVDMYESYRAEDAELILVAYGTIARICKAAVDAARDEGYKAGLIRPVSLYPFPKAALLAASKTAKAFLSVEMSMGQMIEDVKLAIKCSRPVHFYGRTGGVVPEEEEILAKVKEIFKEGLK